MEKFISLALSIIIISWYYINSLKLNSYFKNTNNWKYSILTVFIFTYIFFTVLFLLIDVISISTDKDFLRFKEDFTLNYLFIFEIYMLIIAPLIYIILYLKSQNDDDNQNGILNIYQYKETKIKEHENYLSYSNKNKIFIYFFLYFIYLLVLISINLIYLKFNINLLDNNHNKNYVGNHKKILDDEVFYFQFSQRVPRDLAKYSMLTTDFQKISYLNFGILMMLGKYLGFTYMPYGMSLLVHDIIFKSDESENLNINRHTDNTISLKMLKEINNGKYNDLEKDQKTNISKIKQKDEIENDEETNLLKEAYNNLEELSNNKYTVYIDNEINYFESNKIKNEKNYSEKYSHKSNFYTISKSLDSNSLNNSLEQIIPLENNDKNNEIFYLENKENIKIKLNKKSKNISNELFSLEDDSKKFSIEAENNELNNSKNSLNSMNNSKEKENIECLNILNTKNYIIKEFPGKNETNKENNILKIKKSKDAVVTHETLSSNVNFNTNFYLLKCLFHLIIILICITTIFLILYSKIIILYTKIFYNICGLDCGFLSHRLGFKYTLDFICNYLSDCSQNNLLRYDLFFFTFLLIFRMFSLYKAFSVKGVSFLWKIFFTPSANLKDYQVFQLFTTIFFTGLVLIYDFTYLLPDYLRFNGLNSICDNTTLDKHYCGLSFFGLLFIKISMNFHLFMYFDAIASVVFITTGLIWIIRLIIKPLVYSLLTKINKIDNNNNEKRIFN